MVDLMFAVFLVLVLEDGRNLLVFRVAKGGKKLEIHYHWKKSMMGQKRLPRLLEFETQWM